MAANFQPINISFTYGQTLSELKNVKLKSENATHNLQQLFERKRGSLLHVDDAGKLVKVEGVGNWLSYQWNRAEEREKVRQVINATLEQFNGFLAGREEQKVAELAVKFLFDKTGEYGIGRLGKELYNHKMVKQDNELSKHLLPNGTIRIKFADDKFVDLKHPDFQEKAILPINLGEEHANHNLWMLLKRKQGQIYQANEVTGKLERVENRLAYLWNRKTNDEKVQNIVTTELKRLNIFYSKIQMTQVHQYALEKIFTQDSPLCRMNQKVFSRRAVAEGSNLEMFLAPDLKRHREVLVDALFQLNQKSTKEGKLHVEHAFMDLVYAEFEFTQRKLGIELGRVGDGGSGGARYGFNRFGKKILVIKPGDEGPHGVNNPQWYAQIKRLFVSPRPCLDGNSEPMAEMDSWVCDRSFFEIWSVPPTDVRYVVSRDFVGSAYKECSVQMYVRGCQTLGEYVGVPPKMIRLPRSLLRWYLDDDEVRHKVPAESLKRVAAHNFLTEDIDCHLENILALATDISPSITIIDGIFKNDPDLTKKEISDCVNQLFKKKENQVLLRHLLNSEEKTIDGKRKRVTLVKHDGGSSNPHSHPGFWDIHSLKYKHLFEILPHFDQQFPDEIKDLIQNGSKPLRNFLFEKGMRLLANTMPGGEDFKTFWNLKENQSLFKRWIFTRDIHEARRLATLLRDKLIDATTVDEVKDAKYYKSYYAHHLIRIRGTIRTRIHSFRVLNKYVREDRVMRDVFVNVRDKEEFQQELIGEADPRQGWRAEKGLPQNLLLSTYILNKIRDQDPLGELNK